MHVVILQPYLAPYRVDLFRALQRQPNMRLSLLYFDRPERRRLWKPLETTGLRSLQLRSWTWSHDYEHNRTLLNIPHLLTILRRERPDVVVCSAQSAGKWVWLLRRLVRYRLVLWTEETQVTAAGSRPSRLMLRHFYPALSACVVPGQATIECMVQRYRLPLGRIHWVPNTIDDNLYAAPPGEIAERFATPAPRRVVFVGSLHPRKGADMLLPALRDLRLRRPDLNWELHVVGTGPLAFRTEPGIRLYGHLDSAACARVVRSGHLFVMPSRADCGPMSSLEAAKAGLVPLMSDGCGYHTELAVPHGWAFHRNSLPDLIRAMEEALALPLDVLGHRALATARAVAEWTPERSAAAFHRALQHATEGIP